MPSAQPVDQLPGSVIRRILQPGERGIRKYSGIVLVFAVQGCAKINKLFDFIPLHLSEEADRVLDELAVFEDLRKTGKILRYDVIRDHMAVSLFIRLPVSLYRISAFLVIVSPYRNQFPDILFDRVSSLLIIFVLPSEEGVHFHGKFLLRIAQPPGDQISRERRVLG